MANDGASRTGSAGELLGQLVRPVLGGDAGLIRLAEEMGPQGLAVVGVAVDEGGTAKVKKFVEEFHVPYPVTLPEPGSQIAYGMAGLPTTVLVDRQGRVAKIYVGAVRQADFKTDVAELLAER